MKRIVLKFGLISGAIAVVLMNTLVFFIGEIGFDKGLIVGYTTILISFLLVFFGIRSYRETVGGGYISFGRAFSVGILITLISCICYVVTWEIVYFNFHPDFLEKYNAYLMESARASGASAAEIAQKTQEMESMKTLYNNVFYNAAFTFLEPFPVGLIVTFFSALILRKRRRHADEDVATALPGTPNLQNVQSE